jgi:prepilin-type N-terminal cleavage/methylation domain-containing protein
MNTFSNKQAGLTLVELMVALAIGSFLIIGAIQIYSQSRQAFVGDGWALDVAMSVDGVNNGYTLPCAPGRAGFSVAAQANSDSFTVRRATVVPAALEAGRLQIQTTRIQGRLFADGMVPAGFSPVDSTTHNLLVNSYYVAADSELIPGVPTLRRKSLGSRATRFTTRPLPNIFQAHG